MRDDIDADERVGSLRHVRERALSAAEAAGAAPTDAQRAEAAEAAHKAYATGQQFAEEFGLGVTLYRARSGLIDPHDYATFEAFLGAVQQAWNATWHRAYELRAEREGRPPNSLLAVEQASPQQQPTPGGKGELW